MLYIWSPEGNHKQLHGARSVWSESAPDGVVPTLHDQFPFRLMSEFSHFVQLIGADLIIIFF